MKALLSIWNWIIDVKCVRHPKVTRYRTEIGGEYGDQPIY